MPEVNFNLLAPSAELYSGPQVQMDPVAAYEKAKATRQSNMLAQLYAKHYDPQTGGVNYNALIPEAAQSGLDVTAIMPDIQKQALSQAQVQHYKDLSSQEAESAEKTKRERLNAEMVQHAKESYMRLQNVSTPDQFWAWHLSNPELPGVDKESLSADILQQISTPQGFQQALANSKKALEGITGIKADEGIWKDAGDRLVQIDPVSGKEINSIKKGATPGQVLTNERLSVSAKDYPNVAQAIIDGRLAPNRVNSRNASILENTLKLNPDFDLESATATAIGTEAGSRTLGTVGANQAAAGNEAATMIPIARLYADKVGAGQFKSLNDLSNWASKHTGDKSIVQLNTALNSLVNSYARAINPRGMPTVSDKNHAREILDAGLSNGQLNATLDVMEQEIAAARAGTAAARSEVNPGSKTTQAGGGAQTTPQVGEVRKGYKFKGGNPSDANNWEKVK